MPRTQFAVAASVLLLSTACGVLSGCSATTGEDVNDSSESELSLSSSQKSAYNYFISKGLKNYQAAAIVGNLMQESNVDSTAVQYGNGPGRGIAQWSVGGRWNHDANDNVTAFAAKHGASPWALTTQLDFIWYELTSFSGYGLSELKNSVNLTQAVVAFQNRFEGCGTCNQSGRISDAAKVLSAYGQGSSSSSAAACYSGTLGKSVPHDTCVESKYDKVWYQCDNGSWVDRWSDPSACASVHPL
ncbi:MAG TPA: phage tail tip lysozyme [Polyangiaceae bacterium]